MSSFGRTTVRERISLIGSMASASRSSRGSAIAPLTAAAAAVSGLASTVRAPAALPAFEVAVARADGQLAARHRVAVHADAHRAAGLAPLAAGRAHDLVEAFGFGLALDVLASRARRASARARRRGGRAGCARLARMSLKRPFVHEPMNTTSTGLPEQRLAGLDLHVGERFAERRIAVRRARRRRSA